MITIPGEQLHLKTIPTKDENAVLFTGRVNPITNKYEIFLSKYDSSGNELWTSRIMIQQQAEFYSITEFADSTFYISGFIGNISNFGNLLVHVSKDGLLLSSKVISSPNIYLGYGYDITALNNSSLVFVARTTPVSNYYERGNIIIDAAGNPVSNKFYTVNNKNIVEAKTAKSPTGGFVQVLNMRRYNITNDRILGVMRCDSIGTVLWAKQFGDPNSKYQIYDIKHLSTGEIILCGNHLIQGSDYVGAIICINSNGSLAWAKHFNPIKLNFTSIAENDSSSFIVTGYYADTLIRTKSVLIKMGINGQILNSASFRYSDIIVNNQSTFKDNNNMFYTAYNYQNWNSILYGVLISKYDLGFNFCSPYSVPVTAIPVFLSDSTQWSDTTYSLITTDVTSLFTQIFDPWGYNDHCLSTGTNQLDNTDSELDLFPNPTTGIITIRSHSSELKSIQFAIVDMLGKFRLHGTFKNHTNNLDISSLGKGVYFMRAISGDYSTTKKIIIN